MQKLPINKFEWTEDTSKFNEDFVKNYNEENINDIFLKLMFNILKNYKERMKIEKVEKLVTNLHDKTEYVIHITNLKALIHGLVLKKVVRVIKFNQNTCVKPYIDMNTKLLKKAKINFEKNFFKLMYNAIFWKTVKNVKKQRVIKFVTIERSRNYLVSKLNYRTIKLITKILLAIEM